MNWVILIPAFGLGLLSSLHCVGMCGPLALALPVHHLSKATKFFAISLYQIGRIMTYSLLGLLFGAVGSRIQLAGFQQAFSIVTGIVVILLLILYYGYRYNPQPGILQRFFHRIQRFMSKLLNSEMNLPAFLALGMANGLLPCGMVYIAMATSLTTGSIENGILFMVVFGLGTLPAMMALSYFGQMVSLTSRRKLRRIVPVFIALMGIVLVLRGLGLGIPYISPDITPAGDTVVTCHT